MPELVGSMMMLMGGGMLSASSWTMARSRPRVSGGELAASLSQTPIAAPEPTLDDLMACAAAALDSSI